MRTIIDARFFGSKYFALSAAVAAAILVGGAVAYQGAGAGGWRGWHDGCAAPDLTGLALVTQPETSVEDGGRKRSVVYRLPAAQYTRGAADLCSHFGDVVVDPALDDAVEIRFTITSGLAASVEETEVRAELRDDGGLLRVGGWVPRVGESGTAFHDEGARVTMELRVPANGAWELRARSSAGDVEVMDVVASSLDLSSSFGNVAATGIDLAGDARLDSSAGDVTLALASVQSGAIDASSSFGDVALTLPSRADVGYDVVGETSFGEVTIRIGPTEAYESDGGPGSERESARTVGFDKKLTKVTVNGTSSAGDVTITTTT